MRHHFTWSGQEEGIKRFRQSCQSCQLACHLAAPLKDPQLFALYGPIEHVLMDTCGPFPVPDIIAIKAQQAHQRQTTPRWRVRTDRVVPNHYHHRCGVRAMHLVAEEEDTSLIRADISAETVLHDCRRQNHAVQAEQVHPQPY
mmetsp:Transcript_38512/g.108849  ORF Transcript_38512/g.108849 Transcript_38512/m.108849 type:complete len:143 (+) Transcript_38512:3046-3474(+)